MRFAAASECDTSSWLTTLPITIAEHGFAMPQGEFRDALCLRFDLRLVCVTSFLLCNIIYIHSAALVLVFHNELHNLTAELLSEVCTDVGIEPALQPLDSEPLQYATANREDGARLDVVARDFWVQIGSIFF